MNRLIALVVIFGAVFFLAPPSLFSITIPTVPVGNPGNAPDSNGRGAVAYNYRIGTYEVTNTEYVAFLNAKAASDPLGLYNTNMGIKGFGGITRSGVSGSYTYAVRVDMGNKPVNLFGWYDAARFINWLNNGQGSGDTETGAYTLLHDGSPNPTPIPSNGTTVTRNVGATWFLPTNDEWHKAAYYQPAAEGGPPGDYWIYPTKTNFVVYEAEVSNSPLPSHGDISNPGPNVANYRSNVAWSGGTVTTVGSAGPLSQSFYGTSDQAGNVG
jgi:formylglycine-generating enzyme required for sulfatase activity